MIRKTTGDISSKIKAFRNKMHPFWISLYSKSLYDLPRTENFIKFVTMPPTAAQMIMKASIPPFHIG